MSEQGWTDTESSAESSGIHMADFQMRLQQVITGAGLNQAAFARELGISQGYLSDLCRGQKKPGVDFLSALRRRFGVSIDWMLTGDGHPKGGRPLDMGLIATIRLQVTVARMALLDKHPAAGQLLELLLADRGGELGDRPELGAWLNTLSLESPEMDLVLELYNSHWAVEDGAQQRRNLLAAVTAHFRARQPLDRMAALTGVQPGDKPGYQLNVGTSQRIAGRDYHEHAGKP